MYSCFHFHWLKGGAGGKGTWGRPGDELNQVAVLDNHDPNYDSEELVSYTLFNCVLLS